MFQTRPVLIGSWVGLALLMSLSAACGGGKGSASQSPTISITGLPSGTDAIVTLTGSNYTKTLTASEALTLDPGSYTLKAARVSTGVINGITTGHDYDPRPLSQTISVASDHSFSASAITYNIAASLSSSLVVSQGISDVWSYIAYPLANTTYSWTQTGGILQSSRSDLYGIKWTAPSSSGSVQLACQTEDSYGVTQNFTQTVAVVTPLGAPPANWYGTGVSGDSLANLNVGGSSQQKVSYLFKSNYSGTFTSFRKTLKWNAGDRTGYSGGDGGSLHFALYADDGSSDHLPTGNPLTSTSLKYPMAAGDAYPLVSWPTPPVLTAGVYYHLVITNSDDSPTTNYISTNDLATLADLEPAQPTLNDLDWRVSYRRSGESWTPRRGYLPSLELKFSDGKVQGTGYTAAWSYAPESISGDQQVREVFTVSGSIRNIYSVGIRLRRVSGSSALTILVESEAGNTLGSASMAASSVLTTPHWVSAALDATHTLNPGSTYRLVLQAPSDTVYEVFPIQDGSGSAGFSAKSTFSDGHAEYNPGTGWVEGWTPFTNTVQTDGDLQFYFSCY